MASTTVRSKAVVDTLFIVAPIVCVGFVFGPIYSQGPKVTPQRQKFHRLQCIFTFARKLTRLQLTNVILCFWCHLKVE